MKNHTNPIEAVYRKLAYKLADELCLKINHESEKLDTPPVQCNKAQFLLERVITILETRV